MFGDGVDGSQRVDVNCFTDADHGFEEGHVKPNGNGGGKPQMKLLEVQKFIRSG